MNIFGLFFTFFIPGVVVGMMIMACVYHELNSRKKEKKIERSIKCY